MVSQGEIKGVDNHGVRDDRSVCVIGGGVQMVLL